MQEWAAAQVTPVEGEEIIHMNLTPPARAFPFHFPNEHTKLADYARARMALETALVALRHRAHQESDGLNLNLGTFGRDVFEWAAEEALRYGGNYDDSALLRIEESASIPRKWVLLGATKRGGFQGSWLVPLSPHLDSRDEVVHQFHRPISVSLRAITSWEELALAHNTYKAIAEPMREALDALDEVKFTVRIDLVDGCPSCPH
jgi:hypothetical protein